MRILALTLLALTLSPLSSFSNGCEPPEDADGDGYPADVDCDDNDPDVYPAPDNTEPCVCDGIDQNCNGIIDDFPCDIPCPAPIQEGDLCGGSIPGTCDEGLTCCYPCGIQGCDNICTPTCDPNEPWCSDGCPMYP